MVLAVPIAMIEVVIAVIEVVITSISGLLAIIRVQLSSGYDYKRWLKRDLADCETILELGCGSNSPVLKIGYGPRTFAVDIFKPYVDMHNRHGNYKTCCLADILTMPLPPGAYDAVVICDVLEHLNRDTVLDINLFGDIERCATKKVVIFTPNGYIPNDEVDGDPYQAHVSAWEPEDYYSRGYKVVGATGLRWLFGKASRPRFHPYSIVEIVGMLSQAVVYHKPEWAWHSYAVKEIK